MCRHYVLPSAHCCEPREFVVKRQTVAPDKLLFRTLAGLQKLILQFLCIEREREFFSAFFELIPTDFKLIESGN